MRKLEKYLALIVVMISLVGLSGCKDNYRACVKTGYDISTGITTAMQSVDQAGQAGYLTATEEKNVIGYLEVANQANKVFVLCAKIVHDGGSVAGTFTGCADQFESTLNTPDNLALLNVGNVNQRAQISGTVNTILKAVGDLVTALGGK